MSVRNYFDAHKDELTAWRHHLHRHPGLLFDVQDTADFVTEKLQEFGVDEIVGNIGQTGVVGIIKGKPGGLNHVVGLRADMDALPIEEKNTFAHVSTRPGKMHACGHDGHTTMLLGAAKYLAETRNFHGDIAVIFQPAEEAAIGAKAMLDDGMMERFGIGEVYGLHNRPGLALGTFETRPHEVLASGDIFQITIEGKGTHAARPHKGIDPVLVCSHIHTALQSVVSRNTDPLESVVLTVTQIHAGTADNVVPQTAVMRGAVRCLKSTIRSEVEEQIKTIATGVAQGMRATATIQYDRVCPVTENTPEYVDHAVRAAKSIAGSDNVSLDGRLFMGGEDFSFMLQERPGAHIFLGQGDTHDLHHPEYDFNDDILTVGSAYWVELVEERCLEAALVPA